jgi:hypothetical protein
VRVSSGRGNACNRSLLKSTTVETGIVSYEKLEPTVRRRGRWHNVFELALGLETTEGRTTRLQAGFRDWPAEFQPEASRRLPPEPQRALSRPSSFDRSQSSQWPVPALALAAPLVARRVSWHHLHIENVWRSAKALRRAIGTSPGKPFRLPSASEHQEFCASGQRGFLLPREFRLASRRTKKRARHELLDTDTVQANSRIVDLWGGLSSRQSGQTRPHFLRRYHSALTTPTNARKNGHVSHGVCLTTVSTCTSAGLS